MPGNDGEANDAVSAYTQVFLKDAARLLKQGDTPCPDTWISLPRNRRPPSWDNVEDPAVPLECNLYGHPLAGLLWERHLEEILIEIGWEKVSGWECLYLHRKMKLFLSVYVDDFKLVGKKEN